MAIESQMKELYKNLALQLLPTIAQGMGSPVPPEITRLVLKTFIELLIEEQNNLSERLEVFLKSYYKSGIVSLTNAQNAEQVGTRNEAINRACDRFEIASQVEEDAVLKAKCPFFVGVCYDLKNERALAKMWYEKAYTSASQLATQLQQTEIKIDFFKSKKLATTAGISGLVLFGAATLGIALTPIILPIAAKILLDTTANVYTEMELIEKQKKQQQLEQLHHFINLLSQVLHAQGSALSILKEHIIMPAEQKVQGLEKR